MPRTMRLSVAFGLRGRVGCAAKAIALAALACLAPDAVRAQPTVRVNKAYEDTVRILVVTNMTASGGGECSPATREVGPKTLDFVKQSLAGVPNVKYGDARSTTWGSVQAAFAPKMPHVIVHINAGFYSESGGMDAILDQAANQLIGVVSIGDDAAAFAHNVFGFQNISNADPVMDAGEQFSKLWVEVDPKSDTLQDPGVVRNVRKILNSDTLFFKPFGTDPNGDFRCQADADTYNVDPAYAHNVSFLGFQGAQDNGKPVGGPRQWQVITAFQSLQRRGVALSYQPQFLANAAAAHQIDYDAIMFASFAHAYRDPKFFFTDETGNTLSGDTYWTPSKGKLYLSYTDDFVSANLAKTFKLSIRNRKGGAPSDSETITVQAHVKEAGEKGVWKAEIPLAESRTPAKLNGTAEVFTLGEITATVDAHDDVGKPDGTIATATVKVAYPDLPAKVAIQDAAAPATPAGRFTSSIVIQLQEQSFTKFADDSIRVQVACASSGDKLTDVVLVEKTPGSYVSGSIAKTEGAASPADAVLSCLAGDKITVSYTDAVYGTSAAGEAVWVNDGSAILGFTALDSVTSITTIKDGEGGNTFLVVVKGSTPTISARDELVVTLTTGADVESIRLTETSAASGIFVSRPIRFAFTESAASGNGAVDAVPDPADTSGAALAKARVVMNGITLDRELLLLQAVNLVKLAYIKDLDGDGAGDHVYFEFTRPLLALPSSIGPVYWNSQSPANANAKAPKLGFQTLSGSAFRTVLVADFSASPFPQGLTSVVPGGDPYAVLPPGRIFGGQRPALADSMGPVLVKAILSLDQGDNPTLAQNLDTLRVTVSEALRPRDWSALLRFGKPKDGACDDYAGTTVMVPAGAPLLTAEGLTYTLLLSGDPGAPSPFTGDCAYINVDGGYADIPGNPAPRHGIRIQGPSKRRIAVAMNGYPAVAGMAAGDSAAKGKGWIPPVGFVPGVTYKETLPMPGDLPSGTEAAVPQDIPDGYASVKVVSNRKYLAHVALYDNLGNFVTDFSQSFGYRGELDNPARRVPKGWMGFLTWDLRDKHGQRVGQGVYLWKVNLIFDDATRKSVIIRTGVLRGRYEVR